MKFQGLLRPLTLAFAIANMGSVPSGVPARGVPLSCNSILKNGRITAHSHKEAHQYIDWGRQDSFVKTFRKILDRCIGIIRKDTDFQRLFHKPLWNKADRQEWEKQLCILISTEVDKIPGLDHYRNIHYKTASGVPVVRSACLNDLSIDIDHKTYTHEFDCETQSAFKGVLIQALDNHFLTKNQNGYYKRPQDYYLIIADVIDRNGSGLHAFILTPGGGIFETTDDPSVGAFKPYLLPDTQSFTLQDFEQGKVFIIGSRQKGNLYGFNLTPARVREIRNGTEPILVAQP